MWYNTNIVIRIMREGKNTTREDKDKNTNLRCTNIAVGNLIVLLTIDYSIDYLYDVCIFFNPLHHDKLRLYY